MNKIYYNGTIITLEENNIVESMMVSDGKIVYLGDFKNIKDEKGEFVDLEGRTLMPSFIDPHSHIAAFSNTLLIKDLSGVKTLDEIKDRLLEYIKDNDIKDDRWAIGFGYDHNELVGSSHPTRWDLDKVSTTIPIMITHKSGHMGVINSKAIELLKLDENSKIEGGSYGKDSNGKLNGYLEEKAFMQVSKNTSGFSFNELKNAYKRAEQIYLSYGITTCQDGLTKGAEFELLKSLSKNDELSIDVVSYIDIKDNSKILEDNREYLNYKNHLKIGGYKLILDGSPQGKTAWLSRPYENEEEYSGYPAYRDSEVDEFVDKALNNGVQLLTHCNGDAASEQLINSYLRHKNEDLHRPVMIHAQTVRKDQLENFSKLGMIPSFFVAHTYHWGDIHIKNLGKRAYDISPTKWAKELNLKYTLHQDTPVILPDMWETIWCAVNRITKDGIKLGHQNIEVLDAIKAVTINSAYSYFEENDKGSLKVGKNADFIIIDKNPLTIDKMKLRDIKVLETVKNGITLFKR